MTRMAQPGQAVRTDTTTGRRVLVVGGGFAGFHCARALEKLPPGTVDVTLVSSTDYLLYSPLLPDVAAGVIDPRAVAVPLHRTLSRTRIVTGRVTGLDLAGRTATVTGADGATTRVAYDRLALTSGSVTRTVPVPGLDEHAIAVKTLAEAVYLRDHVLGQLDVADATDDERLRRAATTFVVVGAGYTGTEVTAQLQLFTARALDRYPRLREVGTRWFLVDIAERVLPELGDRLGRYAQDRLRERGVQIRLSTSVEEVTADVVTLSGGERIDARTLVWSAGVQPAPIAAATGLPVDHGRLVVDTSLRVPGHPEVFAAGDAAAVPDVTRDGAPTAPTAQHAQRQGVVLARNLAASLGHGTPRQYRHSDLGLVADLGGLQAVARPLGIPLTGVVAKVVARGYHLYALPSAANRVRVAGGWAMNALFTPSLARLGLVPHDGATLGAQSAPVPSSSASSPADGPPSRSA